MEFMAMCKNIAYGVISANEIAKIPVEKWDVEDLEQVCRGAGFESEFDQCNTKEDMVTLTKKAVVTLMQDVKNVYEPNLATVTEQGKKKRKTHTSTEVKNRYRAKTYSSVQVMVRKEVKPRLKEAAESRGKPLSALMLDGFYYNCPAAIADSYVDFPLDSLQGQYLSSDCVKHLQGLGVETLVEAEQKLHEIDTKDDDLLDFYLPNFCVAELRHVLKLAYEDKIPYIF